MSKRTWHCTVQFELRRTREEFFAAHEDTRVTTGSTQFVKELLITPGNCSILSGRALADSRLISNAAALAVEARDIAKNREDKLMVVFGEWQTHGLYDGLAWKNNSSTNQREAPSPTLPVKKLTTLVPRDVTVPLKKYHVAVNGFTFVYYHITNKNQQQQQPQQQEHQQQQTRKRKRSSNTESSKKQPRVITID